MYEYTIIISIFWTKSGGLSTYIYISMYCDPIDRDETEGMEANSQYEEVEWNRRLNKSRMLHEDDESARDL
jgi:hypothetical protein